MLIIYYDHKKSLIDARLLVSDIIKTRLVCNRDVFFIDNFLKELCIIINKKSKNYFHKIALAEVITQQLWVKGLIAQKQREQIDQHSREELTKTNC